MIETNVTGLVRNLRFLDRVGELVERRMEKSTKRALKAGAQILETYVKDSIQSENAVATGQLLNSVKATGIQASSGQITIGVGSSLKYASFIEEGTNGGGGLPPVQDIYDWMLIKGLDATPMSAYFIAKAIQRRGFRDDRKPFSKGANRAESQIQALFKNELERSMNF